MGRSLRTLLAPSAAFVAVLALGAAFMRQGVEHRTAEQRLRATASSDLAAARLAAAGRSIAAAARDWDTGDGQVPAHPAVDALVAINAQGNISRSTGTPIGMDAAELLEGAEGQPSWSRPLRAPSGEVKLALRMPRTSMLRLAPALGSDPGGGRAWSVAIVDPGRLAQAARLDALAADGFIFQLRHGAWPVAGSMEAEAAGTLTRDWDMAGSRWSLAVAPAGDETGRLLLQGLLVFVLAMAAALCVRERRHEDELLRSALGERDSRVAELTRRLTEEVEERQSLERQFDNASFHDAHTGLPNRRFVSNRLAAALRRTRAGRPSQVAVAIFGVEGVGAAAEGLGLTVADELLTQIARRMETASAGLADRTVARLQDAQFALAMADLEATEPAFAAVQGIEAALAEPFQVSGHTLFVSLRTGIAFAATGYEHADDLLRSAQIALGQAQAQRSRLCVFDTGSREQVVSRHQLETALHGVAERGELRLNYQPIVALDSGRIVGFEALVRWQHPVEGLIPPGVFISIAEDTGLISGITRWALREAVAQARAWQAKVAPEAAPYVSVNLSAHDMAQADLAPFIQQLVAGSGLAPGTLRLEVTEGSMIDNTRETIEVLKRLREGGARILLDDFGTGYSSLSYLHALPVDYLKIDQSFVRRMLEDPRSLGIVRAILGLAEAMDIRTVAEGIESREAMHKLAEMKCTYGQGYLFSKPVDAERATRLLASPAFTGAGELVPA